MVICAFCGGTYERDEKEHNESRQHQLVLARRIVDTDSARSPRVKAASDLLATMSDEEASRWRLRRPAGDP
jgi:hypothetical protein